MPEFVWRNRTRVAAAALLFESALLVLIDAISRPGHPALYVVASILTVCAAISALRTATPSSKLMRLVPAAIVFAATATVLITTSGAQTSAAPVGLSLVAATTLVYVGFVLPPGWALMVSPVVLTGLMGARLAEPERISLALPLLAVPISVFVAELVSMLTDRAEVHASRSTARLERLGELEDVLRRFRRPGDLNQAAKQVAQAALEIFDVKRSTVVLRDSAGALIAVSLGPVTNSEPDAETSGLVTSAMSGDQPHIVPTGSAGDMLVLPLPAAGNPAGVLLVYPVPSDDTEFTLDLARLFGVQIGIAIEHLYVIDALAKASTRDALTGIGNRRHADSLLASLQAGDALILLDLDYLKTVNDTLGHAAGDQVLQELSAHLRICLRDSDMSARLGGDEFLIVARNAHADPLAVARRVLSGWEGKGGLTTLSAGVALHEPSTSSPATFERADAALYRAKAAGRDQAQLWTQGQESPASG